MAKPIYQLFTARYSEAWFQLSQEEQAQLLAKQTESLEKAGAKVLVFAESIWSSEKWQAFGVTEFPDLESLQAHTDRLIEIQWYRYIEGKVILGREYVLS